MEDGYLNPSGKSPERNLVAAVMERAFNDLIVKEDGVAWLAYYWLMAEDDGVWSFKWCLLQMGLEDCLSVAHARVRYIVSGLEYFLTMNIAAMCEEMEQVDNRFDAINYDGRKRKYRPRVKTYTKRKIKLRPAWLKQSSE